MSLEIRVVDGVDELGINDQGRLRRMIEWQDMSIRQISEYFGISYRKCRESCINLDYEPTVDFTPPVPKLDESWDNRVVELRNLREEIRQLVPCHLLRSEEWMTTMMLEVGATVSELSWMLDYIPEYLVRMWAGIHGIPHFQPSTHPGFHQYERPHVLGHPDYR